MKKLALAVFFASLSSFAAENGPTVTTIDPSDFENPKSMATYRILSALAKNSDSLGELMKMGGRGTELGKVVLTEYSFDSFKVEVYAQHCTFDPAHFCMDAAKLTLDAKFKIAGLFSGYVYTPKLDEIKSR